MLWNERDQSDGVSLFEYATCVMRGEERNVEHEMIVGKQRRRENGESHWVWSMVVWEEVRMKEDVE